MNRYPTLFVAMLFGTFVKAQLSGILQVPSTYTSLVSVINLLNAQGTNGPVTVAISAGYAETAPFGGYTLTASGSSLSPIYFQKTGSGANPLITAYSGGNRTPGSVTQDGIWRLIGSDYVTIDGIDLYDPNTSNPQTMEFGYGFFKSSAANGCQYNTIKNCVVMLNRLNAATGGGPASDGSRGIEMVNAFTSSHSTPVIVNNISGSHSFNKFYSNTIYNCHIAISMIGFADNSPFSFSDSNNEVGGNSQGEGNFILNFGGGGSQTASAGVRTFAQYDLKIVHNLIHNNTGTGVNHQGTLRAIQLNSATSANSTVFGNTITLHGGGTASQVFAIDNGSGSTATANTVIINNNVIINSSNENATSASFYGIYNTASPANISIANNTFSNNSTSALSGNTYLIYNSGAVATLISVSGNSLSFAYTGPSAYSGVLYNIYNTGGAASASLHISGNLFYQYRHLNVPGTGAIYFINNSADLFALSFIGNLCRGLVLNHSGPEYFLYNSSSTQSVLAVCNNSLTQYIRAAPAAHLYGYYGAATTAGSAIHTFSGNLISDISANIPGSGNFYGLYNSEGGISPYPLKTVFSNTVSNISMNGTGTFYAFHLSDLGSGNSFSGSEVYNNVVSEVSFANNVYGMYLSSPISPLSVSKIHDNTVYNLNSTGASASVYGNYLGGNNAGIQFYRNKTSKIQASGSAGVVQGIYVTGSGNILVLNNLIGDLTAPFSAGPNRLHGIYVSAGVTAQLFHNTVLLAATSVGSNFGSNALYASSTSTLYLRNNIFINNSVPTGTGITAAYRRSSSTISTYSVSSNNNIFYAGTPGPAHVIFHNGSLAHQSLSTFQTAFAPRESLSQSQNISFLSQNGLSPNYLHVSQNVPTSAESGAQWLSGVTSDYDQEARQGSTGYAGTGSAPDLGADEFELNLAPCSTANAGTVSPAVFSNCAGQTANFIASGFTPGTGLLFQWKISTTPGGPYINVSGGTGAGTPEYTTAALSSGIYFLVMEISCPGASAVAISNQTTLQVMPVPTSAASAISTVVCRGQNLSLLGNSNFASGYFWLGPNGFYSHEQNPLLSNPGLNAAGVYSLQSRAGICTSSFATLAVMTSEIQTDIIISEPVICLGSSSELILTGTASGYTWNTGATSASISVSPTITTVYTVVTTNTANCSLNSSVSISVIEPTISAIGALACDSAINIALAVKSDSLAQINWYTASGSTISIGTGTSIALSASSSNTVFAQAKIHLQKNLFTQLSGINSYPTTMFNIAALSSITLTGVGVHLAQIGTHSLELWYRIGSFSGFNLSNSGWTLAGTATVSGMGNGKITELPFNFVLPLATGQTAALCIAAISGSLNCSGASGSIFASNNDLQVSVGNAGTYFNVSVVSQGFNGIVHYIRESCTTGYAPVSLTVVPSPTIVPLAVPAKVCPGKSTVLSAIGASSYTWSGQAAGSSVLVNPQANKIYTVTGTDQYGCTNTATLIIELHTVPTLSVAQAAVQVCPSTSTGFTVSGASTYTWSTGPNGSVVSVTPALNTTYTVYGSSTDGCISSKTLALSTRSVPVITILPAKPSVCSGASLTLSASGASTYTWLPGERTGSQFTLVPLGTALYNVIGKSVNGCTAIALAYVQTEQCTQIRPASKLSQSFCVFPNPCSDHFILMQDAESFLHYSLINSLGAEMLCGTTCSKRLTVDVSAIPDGIYFIAVSRKESGETKKLVITREN